MKKNYLKKGLLSTLVLVAFMSGSAKAQITITSGAALHYAGGDFKSGIIDNTKGGTFSISTSYAPDNSNYVKGEAKITKAVTDIQVSLESNSKERMPTFTTTGEATVSYTTSAPSGTAPSNTVLADKGVYTLTGAITKATATAASGTNFSGADASKPTTQVYFNNNAWSTTLPTPTPINTKMSFAKATTLGIDALDMEHFSLYPNPVSVNNNSVHFTVPASVNQVGVTIYAVTGALVKNYQNIAVQSGENTISKTGLAQGMYIVRFTFNKGGQSMTKRLIVK